MYIEKLKIKGFKCYAIETIVSFDRHVNIIVGKNGSGKSTLFHALALVLGAALPRGDNARAVLISNGCPSAVIAILINNESGRLPVAGSPILLKRKFTPRTDTIQLNKKCITLPRLRAILEVSGFPVHPHYFSHSDTIETAFELSDETRFKELKKATCFVQRERVNKVILEVMGKNKQEKNEMENTFKEFDAFFNNESDLDVIDEGKFRGLYVMKKCQKLEKKKCDLLLPKIANTLNSINDREKTLNILNNLPENSEEAENLVISNSINQVQFSIYVLESKINCERTEKVAILKRQNDDKSDLNNLNKLKNEHFENFNNIRMKLNEKIRMIANPEPRSREIIVEETAQLQSKSNDMKGEIEAIKKEIERTEIKIRRLDENMEKLNTSFKENELVIKQFDYEKLVDKMRRLQREGDELNASRMVAKNKLISIERSLFPSHYQVHQHKTSKINLQNQLVSLKEKIKKLDVLLKKNISSHNANVISMEVLKQEIDKLETNKATLNEKVCAAVEQKNLLSLDLFINEKALKNKNILLNNLTQILQDLYAEIVGLDNPPQKFNFDEIVLNREIDELFEKERKTLSNWENISQRLLAKEDEILQSSKNNLAINIDIEEKLRNYLANLQTYQQQLTILEKTNDLRKNFSSRESVEDFFKIKFELEWEITDLQDKLAEHKKHWQGSKNMVDALGNEIIDSCEEIMKVIDRQLYDSKSQLSISMSEEELLKNFEALKKKIEESKLGNKFGDNKDQATANYFEKGIDAFKIAANLTSCTAQDQLNKIKEAFTLLKQVFERIVNDLLQNYQSKLIFLINSTNDGRVTFKFAVKDDYDYGLSLKSLSLSEKATVFLALTFALQNHNQCPIYMFDEADRHLDKAALRRYITFLSNELLKDSTSQFIITTIHEEMFSLSETVIKISLEEMQSNVSTIDNVEASEIIAEEVAELHSHIHSFTPIDVSL